MIESHELNFGQIFFMTLGFLPVLACFPCWVVAKFIYEPYIKQLAEESKHIVNEPIRFEWQFPIDKAGSSCASTTHTLLHFDVSDVNTISTEFKFSNLT